MRSGRPAASQRTAILLLLAAVSVLVLAPVAAGQEPPVPVFEPAPVLPDDCPASVNLSAPNANRNVAVSPTGDLYVTFRGFFFCQQSTDAGVWVSKSTDRGETFGAPVLVAPTFAYPPSSIAVDANGVVYVVWIEYIENGGPPARKGALQQGLTAFLSRSTDGGATWSAPNEVATALEGGGEGGPSVHLAVDAPYVYVLPGGVDALFVNGASGVGPFTATPLEEGGAFSDVHVDPLTRYVYVQIDTPTVSVQRSVDHGATFGPASVAGNPAAEVFFSTAALASGPGGPRLFVAGSEGGESRDGSKSPYRDKGGKRALDVGETGFRIDLETMAPAPIEVGVNEATYGRQLAADGCGNLIDAYTGYPDGPLEYIRVSNDQGATWGPEIPIGYAYDGHVAINPATGDVVVAYSSPFGGIFVNVYEDLLVPCGCATQSVPLIPSGTTALCQWAYGTAQITTDVPGATFQWFVTPHTGGGVLVGPTNGPTVQFQATSPGVFAVSCKVTDPATGCYNYGHLNPVVTAAPPIPAITAPPNSVAGATGLVASTPAVPGSSYVWAIENGTITSGQGTSAIVFATPTGGVAKLTVSLVNQSGCASKPGTAYVNVYSSGAPCEPDEFTLCLQQNRFWARVDFVEYTKGYSGKGIAVPLTGDSGYLWFLDASNMELFVKVLDGRSVNGKFWVFFGSLTDMEFTVTVIDTLTGAEKTYHNPQHQLASVGDTDAFDDALPKGRSYVRSDEAPAAAGHGLYGQLAALQYEALPASERKTRRSASASAPAQSIEILRAERLPEGLSKSALSACAGDNLTLCLNAGRFKVTVDWINYNNGQAGVGRAVPLSSDSGYFWFFEPKNVEIGIKVLGQGPFLLMYASLSDVEYTITVTDTVTGTVQTYYNPPHHFASVADATSF